MPYDFIQSPKVVASLVPLFGGSSCFRSCSVVTEKRKSWTPHFKRSRKWHTIPTKLEICMSSCPEGIKIGEIKEDMIYFGVLYFDSVYKASVVRGAVTTI